MLRIYDYDFSHAEPTPEQLSELAHAADVVSVTDLKENKTVDERFNELCEQHNITPKDIDRILTLTNRHRMSRRRK